MSKEQDFYKLIETQNQEEKDSLWRKIEQQQDEEVIELGEVLGKKHTFKQKIIIIASSLVCFFVAITIILVCTLTTKKDDGIRYCDSDEYYYVEADTSIEQYASNNGKDLLYFDWYKECEYYLDQHYKLKDTDEVICLREELIDESGNYIIQNVTDVNIKLDFLDSFKNCKERVTIKSYEVYWSSDSSTGQKAYFVYNNHVYYISVIAANDMGYILSLVEELIK